MIVQELSSDMLNVAAQDVFETLVFLDLQPVTESHRHWSSDSVLGSITFNGAVEGCFGFTCPAAGAAVMAQSMLGLSPTESLTRAETRDAIGEVTQLIMGNLKTILADIFGDIQTSVPTVIWGQQLEHGLGETAQTVYLGVTLAENIPAELSLLWHA